VISVQMREALSHVTAVITTPAALQQHAAPPQLSLSAYTLVQLSQIALDAEIAHFSSHLTTTLTRAKSDVARLEFLASPALLCLLTSELFFRSAEVAARFLLLSGSERAAWDARLTFSAGSFQAAALPLLRILLSASASSGRRVFGRRSLVPRASLSAASQLCACLLDVEQSVCIDGVVLCHPTDGVSHARVALRGSPFTVLGSATPALALPLQFDIDITAVGDKFTVALSVPVLAFDDSGFLRMKNNE